MILSIIGIVIGLVAVGLIFLYRKDQIMTNALIESDIKTIEKALTSFMTDFINHQLETDRKIAELEKQLKIQTKNHSTRMDKMNKSLPSVIGQVVGQIEFAQERINKK